jgi:hypothetical protein
MADFIIKDGDQAMFLPNFGNAMVVVRPGNISSSSKSSIQGSAMCVKGDESSVSVPGCMYTAPPYVIPGSGTLTIKALASDQLAKKYLCGEKKVILKGGQFDAEFQVQSPAQQPTPSGPVPDATPMYSGKGMFITTNMKHYGQ